MTDDLFGGLLQQPEEEAWREHWKGMPEFNQPDAEPWKSIVVHFETEKDMLDFAKLMDQRITFKTPSIWFPKVERLAAINKLWIDKPTSDAT